MAWYLFHRRNLNLHLGRAFLWLSFLQETLICSLVLNLSSETLVAWLQSLRFCCIASYELLTFRCHCLGLSFGVQLLSRDMFVEVEHHCAFLGDHLKTLMNTWGWSGITFGVHFDVNGCISLETYFCDHLSIRAFYKGGSVGAHNYTTAHSP